ncbi:zinc finger, C2H2 type [Ancylostoma caninum]|uniref:Zinc finger, C2H2 type n=1 Tax=Ancylostoma caninum TaxID=29170 RepID=A0A368FH33_ANCCA|nr:zinc finger, C2H2 type [Ancylostoma caninum]
MTSFIDDSIWPDGEVLTEYVICKAVYRINPRKAAILYPKPFVEKLDELIAKRGICAPALRDLVLLYRNSLLASGKVSKIRFQHWMEVHNCDSSPQQFTKEDGQRPEPSHPTVADQPAPASSSPVSSDGWRKRRPLEEMLRMPNLKTKLVRPPPQKSSVVGYSERSTVPSTEEEAKNLLSGEDRKASVRKVWFSPVEERRRRSIWNPSAIPTKGLLKKRRSESSLVDTPATSENTPQDSQISRALSAGARECLEERHRAATHEKPVGGPATSITNERLRKKKASRERSPDLEQSPPSLNPVDPERECRTGEQESSKLSTGSHTYVDSEAALSDVSASTGSTHVCKEKQEKNSALNDHDLSVGKSCHANNDFESGSMTSIPSTSQITCKTSSSRRKQKAPQRFQTPLKCESSVREERNPLVLSGSESPGSNDARPESPEVLKQASTPEASSGPDVSSTVDTSSAPVVLKTRRKSKCTDVRKTPKSPENVYPGQFECPLCSNRYANARGLRAHVVRAHREVVEDNEGSPEKKATQPIEEPSGSPITNASLNESDDKDLIVLPSPRSPSSGEIKKGSSSRNIPDVDMSPSTPSHVRITGGVEDLLSYLICPSCKAIFVEKLSVEKHVRAVHPKLSCCPYDMERDGKCELDELKVKEILAKLMCAYCEHMSTRQSHLRLHQKRVHPSLEARPYDFDKDGKIDLSAYVVRQDFVDLTRLEMTALKSVVCATCKKIFCKPNAVSRHVIAAHKGSATVTWRKNDVIDTAMIGIQRIREVLATLICYECKKAFADPIDLKRHRRRSHKPSPLTESKES